MDGQSLPLFDELPCAPDARVAEEGARPRLQPLYYLVNFRLALETLRVRYADLLSSEETGFIGAFVTMPETAQRLLTRLVMRKGPFYRRATLRYPEIPDLPGALDVLVQQGLVELDPQETASTLREILNRAELRWILGSAASRAPASEPSRDQLALPIETECGDSRTLSRWHVALKDRFVKLTAEPVIRRLQWLFFGNDHQDWGEFVLTDLGAIRYERVPTDSRSRAFESREEIEHFYRLNECRARLRADVTALTVCADARLPGNVCAWLHDRFTRLHLRLGERLEAENELDRALDIYSGTGCAEGRVRAVRLMERLGRHEEARRDALAARANGCTESQREALDRVLKRLERRLDRKVVPHRLGSPPALLNLTVPRDSGLRVERSVAAQLASAEAPAFYVENGLLNSLFGLWCWEALFTPVPGAFFHPFQAGPADLHTAQFQAQRAGQFEALMNLLDTGQHEARIWQNYRAKAGIHTHFVRWHKLKPQLLKLALQCIPASHLKLCFQRILENIRENSTGLPDLIQFWPGERRYSMIEVKAPGDRLQDNQRRWMAFFAANNMPAAVCHVRWHAA
jgi:hypothetical protein